MVGARTEGSCSGNLQLGDLNPQLGFTVKITLVQPPALSISLAAAAAAAIAGLVRPITLVQRRDFASSTRAALQ
jgi:hypothetical protein